MAFVWDRTSGGNADFIGMPSTSTRSAPGGVTARATRGAATSEPEEELVVFAYSCKLFRDDEKATWLDEGNHLIPWMGDASVTMDRYDCRLHLHDLKECEAPPPGAANAGPTAPACDEEEALEETMCDEERYADLERDLSEEQLYNEEEAKRMQAALGDRGAMIPLNYDDDASLEQTSGCEPATPRDDGDDEADGFVPPEELRLPVGVEFPSSAKVNAIIEKTALFISQQQNGAQMEIIIKAKQSRNAQFNFLDWGNRLNDYYKHVLKMIKEKKYTPKPVEIPVSKSGRGSDDESGSDSDDDGGGYYLHPSLLGGGGARAVDSPKPISEIVSIKYKLGEENDVYSQLYNSLAALAPKQTKEPAVSEPAVAEPEQQPEREPSETEKGADRSAMLTQSQAVAHAQQQWWNQWHAYNAAMMSPAPPPPPDLCPIIERMAEYVARNGPEFEAVVRKRSDSRFDFILPTNVYYPYYQMRVTYARNLLASLGATGTVAAVGVESKQRLLGGLPKSGSTGQLPNPVDNEAAATAERVAKQELKPLQKGSVPISFVMKTRAQQAAAPGMLPSSSVKLELDTEGDDNDGDESVFADDGDAMQSESTTDQQPTISSGATQSQAAATSAPRSGTGLLAQHSDIFERLSQLDAPPPVTSNGEQPKKQQRPSRFSITGGGAAHAGNASEVIRQQQGSAEMSSENKMLQEEALKMEVLMKEAAEKAKAQARIDAKKREAAERLKQIMQRKQSEQQRQEAEAKSRAAAAAALAQATISAKEASTKSDVLNDSLLEDVLTEVEQEEAAAAAQRAPEGNGVGQLEGGDTGDVPEASQRDERKKKALMFVQTLNDDEAAVADRSKRSSHSGSPVVVAVVPASTPDKKAEAALPSAYARTLKRALEEEESEETKRKSSKRRHRRSRSRTPEKRREKHRRQKSRSRSRSGSVDDRDRRRSRSKSTERRRKKHRR